MRQARYRFRSVWHLDAPADHAYEALRDLTSYPQWWPQVRDVRALDHDEAAMLCRSALPYDLRLVVQRRVQDPAAGVLEARLSGDLEGVSRWTIATTGGGCRALFEEDVVTTRPLMNALAVVARPLFRLNHAWMMRGGQRGLRCFLAGMGHAGRVDDSKRPGPPRRGTGPFAG